MNVVEWLLTSDPSIRWQVTRDLTEEPGERIDRARTQFSYPRGYHYDVLRGLDYLRSAPLTTARCLAAREATC